MLSKTVNGFRIICAEWKALDGCYVILGERPNVDGTHEYVTAKMRSLDDSEWFYGDYFNGTREALMSACRSFNERTA